MIELERALRVQEEKENIMAIDKIIREHGGVEVQPIELYQEMFQVGDGMIQRHSKSTRDLVANPLIYMKNDANKRGQYRILFEDTMEEILNEAWEHDFAITNGLTYFGRKNTLEHANKMFAMIFDLDGVGEREIISLFSGMEAKEHKIYPLPNYMVLSGHGLHLYYLFDWALPLYPNIKLQLKNFKYGMTRRLWNGNTSQLKKPQYQGINQGFRVAGGNTKIDGYRSRVFRLNTHPWTLKQLCEYVPEEYWVDEDKLFKDSKYTLEEAIRRFPDWYQRIVVEKQPRKSWRCNKALYNWWFKRIRTEATFGHRYYCIMVLAIYAMKCGVPREQLVEDAYSLQGLFNDINPHDPFTDRDIECALECYDECYYTYPVHEIRDKCEMPMPHNTRNGRTRNAHIKYMNFVRTELNQNTTWNKIGNGRKPAQGKVLEWRKNNPDGTKYRCIKETGLSKPTVYKWWDSHLD